MTLHQIYESLVKEFEEMNKEMMWVAPEEVDSFQSFLTSSFSKLLEGVEGEVEGMFVSWDFSEDEGCVLVGRQKDGVTEILQEGRGNSGRLALSDLLLWIGEQKKLIEKGK